MSRSASRPGDRRAVELSLTAAGRTEAEREVHEGIGSALGDRDVAAASKALRKLVAGRPAGDAIDRRH